jgi:hypothetical protein
MIWNARLAAFRVVRPSNRSRNHRRAKKFPAPSVQLTALLRAPGKLLVAAVPWAPYVSGCMTRLDPPIHVHCPELYSHRSLRTQGPPLCRHSSPFESLPCPPKSQRITGLIGPGDGIRACPWNVAGGSCPLGSVGAELVGHVRPIHPGPFASGWTVLPQVVEDPKSSPRVVTKPSEEPILTQFCFSVGEPRNRFWTLWRLRISFLR